VGEEWEVKEVGQRERRERREGKGIGVEMKISGKFPET
jgi:hypothetical protein